MSDETNITDAAALLDQLAEIVIQLDGEGRVHYANLALERVLGYPPRKIADGQPHWDVWHPDDLSTVLELAPRVLQGDRFSPLVHRMRHANGHYLTFESTARSVKLANGTTGMMVTCRDVSLRVDDESAGTQLESQIFIAPRSSNMAVMAGGVAHDFGNILQGILASVELARGDEPDDRAYKRHLDSIAIATRRAGDLCKQLLAYSGRGIIEREHLDINGMIGEMLGLLRTSISKKVVIDAQLTDGSLWISADATRMRQMLMNLVINAAEAIGERTGRIIVRTRNVDGKVLLVVDDNGVGMNAETCDQIFEPYFSKKFPGRGLGLASVRATIDAHDGHIEVESSPGIGTNFRIDLPLVDQPVSALLDDVDERDVAIRDGCILFVDDEVMVRDTGAALLRKARLDVVVASNGAEAVRAVEAIPGRFQCIVLDLTMPVMDGREALQLIRRIAPELPVVLCSGYHEQQIEDLVSNDPHTVFLAKPYHPKRLLANINRALSTDD